MKCHICGTDMTTIGCPRHFMHPNAVEPFKALGGKLVPPPCLTCNGTGLAFVIVDESTAFTADQWEQLELFVTHRPK